MNIEPEIVDRVIVIERPAPPRRASLTAWQRERIDAPLSSHPETLDPPAGEWWPWVMFWVSSFVIWFAIGAALFS